MKWATLVQEPPTTPPAMKGEFDKSIQFRVAEEVARWGMTANSKLVGTDIQDRAIIGHDRYGTFLFPHNGRRPLVDAYQELLDYIIYLEQDLEERHDPAVESALLSAAKFAGDLRWLLDRRYPGES